MWSYAIKINKKGGDFNDGGNGIYYLYKMAGKRGSIGTEH